MTIVNYWSRLWRRTEPPTSVPVIPPLPPDYRPVDPNPVVAICGECGLHVHAVMWYCCPNARCPTGLGGANLSHTEGTGDRDF